ncbi:uncharacterized protein LOC111070642 [Drosophila obscura]|uniref:uncharacterized protein LOC111070642 n=1 Tax=Drosophila obscura TaxID=7282 RepID=UPI000BA17CBB|nr:uncharacterized protein LOC111070642 [Drosophila obscura]
MADFKCRICLKDAVDPVDIFAKQKQAPLDDSLPYEPEDLPANLIRDFTGLSVQEGDGHHQYLCQPCFEQLRKAFRFKRKYCRSMQSQAPVKRELTDEEISINDDNWPPVNVRNEAEIDDDCTLPVINEVDNDNTAAEYFEIIETDDLDLYIKTEEVVEDDDEVEEITPNPPRVRRTFTNRVVAPVVAPLPNNGGPPPLHYQCIHCPMTFTKKMQLLHHSRSHKKRKLTDAND